MAALQDMTRPPAVSWEKPQTECLQLMLMHVKPPRWSRRLSWSADRSVSYSRSWEQSEHAVWSCCRGIAHRLSFPGTVHHSRRRNKRPCWDGGGHGGYRTATACWNSDYQLVNTHLIIDHGKNSKVASLLWWISVLLDFMSHSHNKSNTHLWP